MIRSRAIDILNDEKPTKYFCSLESHNFTSKIIPKLVKENGKIITQQNQILQETEQYYKNLYSSKEGEITDIDLNKLLNNYNIPKLNQNESNNLEGLLTLSELSSALKNMKNNRSPGVDGFSCEFFKMFWRELGTFVLRAINYSYETGEFSVAQQDGIITLIPKENKSRHLLTNYRPICLLNTVYKLASAGIANRIKTVLNKLIGQEQTGFISGHYIGENTRIIYDLMQLVDEQNKPGLLLLVDFEKAFDSLSWSFIEKVFKFFNFGPSVIKWISTLYKNSSLRVSQGGNFSSPFKVERGCKQGDPLSPYIFIICAEILAIKIRNNDKIKGIKIDDFEFLLTQFADDTTVILDGSEASLNETLNELEQFKSISGLKVNFQKTQVIWIGSKKYTQDAIKTKWKLTWGINRFKLLGITFDTDMNKMIDINYAQKIETLKSKILAWQRRHLTPIGKITVIKTLLIPSLNHLFLALPNPTDKVLKELQDMFFKFVWDGVYRIKSEVMYKDYIDGGLKMINIQAFLAALKSTWIRRLILNQQNWTKIIGQYINVEKFFCCGKDNISTDLQNIKNIFWQDVLKAHIQLIAKTHLTENSFLSSPIFYNDDIKIAKVSFFYSKCFENGGKFVNDVVGKDGKFYSFQEAKEKFDININYMQYFSMIHAIKKWQKELVLTNITEKLPNPLIPTYLYIYMKNKKGCKNMYIILNHNTETATGRVTWSKIYDFDDIAWNDIYLWPFKITKDTTLQWFQTRINHNILATNNFLHRIKYIKDPRCSFCAKEPENIRHL